MELSRNYSNLNEICLKLYTIIPPKADKIILNIPHYSRFPNKPASKPSRLVQNDEVTVKFTTRYKTQ